MIQITEVHISQIKLAKIFCSALLLGPPLNDKVIKLVAHLFSAEEAEIACHLPFYKTASAGAIASKSRRKTEEITPLLEAMAMRRVIVSGENGYSLIPLIPGMFEYMLIKGDDSTWHHKYAELLRDMLDTGYIEKYSRQPLPVVRNIPVNTRMNENNVADEAFIHAMIMCHDEFAVANVCQCRQTMFFTGHKCRRSSPEDGCLLFGSFASSSVKSGNSKPVSRDEMKRIAEDRRRKNLVFLTANINPENPNAVCTCCDCCCHALEWFNLYRGNNLVAAPLFLANVDEALCDNCGLCCTVCNTSAHSMADKRHLYNPEKCIGCTLCIDKCKTKAISIIHNPSYKKPYKNFKNMSFRLLPSAILSVIKSKSGSIYKSLK